MRPQRSEREGQRALPRGKVRLLRHSKGDAPPSATCPPRRAPPPLTRALPPPQVIEQTMAAHERDFKLDPSLEDIIATDEWARQQVVEEAARLAKAPVLL